MKKIVAVPYENGEVFQHFGHTEVFKLYTTEGEKILSAQLVNTDGSGHGLLAEFLNVHGAGVLLCGGIGAGAKDALAQKGIAIFPGITGDADTRVQEFLNGTLLYNAAAQCNHHHEGDHDCGGEHTHHCGGHGHE